MKTNKSLKVFKTANTVKSVNNIHKVSTKHKTHKKSYNKHKYVKKSLIGGSGIPDTDTHFTNFHKKMEALIGKKTQDNTKFESIETIKALVFKHNIVLYAFLILYFIIKRAFKINITDVSNKTILAGIISNDIIPHIAKNNLLLNIDLFSIRDNNNNKENNNKLFTYLNNYFTDKGNIQVVVGECLNITNNLGTVEIITIEITPPTQPIAASAENFGYLDLDLDVGSHLSSSSYLSVDPSTQSSPPSSSEYIEVESNPDLVSETGTDILFYSARSSASPSFLSVESEPELVTTSEKTIERNKKLFGLHNIKDVCYITVCLQLLWQISDIRDALIDDKKINVSGVLLAIKKLFTNIDNDTQNTLKDKWIIEDSKHGKLDRNDKVVVVPSDNHEGAYTFDTWPFFIEISKIVPTIQHKLNYLKNQGGGDASEIMSFIYECLQDIGSFSHLIYYSIINIYQNQTINEYIKNNIKYINTTNCKYFVFQIGNGNTDLTLINTLSPEINVNMIVYKLKGCVVYDKTPKNEHYIYYRYNNAGEAPEFRLNDSSVKQYNSTLSDKTTLQYINKYATIVLYERTP